MIVKVQRELTTGSENKTVCIYNKSHSIHCIIPTTEQILNWFKPHEYKFYAEAKFDEEGINFLYKVPDQDW